MELPKDTGTLSKPPTQAPNTRASDVRPRSSNPHDILPPHSSAPPAFRDAPRASNLDGRPRSPQNLLFQDLSWPRHVDNRTPPPRYPYRPDQRQDQRPDFAPRFEDLFFSSFGSALDRLASSIDTQAKTAQLAMDRADESKEAALPGTLPTKVTRALNGGSFVSILACWDKDVAKERATSSFDKSLRTPKAADEMEWNDWMLAMTTLSRRYEEFGQANLAKQIINLITGALIASATDPRDHHRLGRTSRPVP